MCKWCLQSSLRLEFSIQVVPGVFEVRVHPGTFLNGSFFAVSVIYRSLPSDERINTFTRAMQKEVPSWQQIHLKQKFLRAQLLSSDLYLISFNLLRATLWFWFGLSAFVDSSSFSHTKKKTLALISRWMFHGHHQLDTVSN